VAQVDDPVCKAANVIYKAMNDLQLAKRTQSHSSEHIVACAWEMFKLVVPFFKSHVAQFPPTNTVAQYCLGHLGANFIKHEACLLVQLTELVLEHPHQLRLVAPLYDPTCSHETFSRAYVTLIQGAIAHPEKAGVAIQLLPTFEVEGWIAIAAPDEVAAFQISIPIGFDDHLMQNEKLQQLQLQVTSDYCLLMSNFFAERAEMITQQVVSTALSVQMSMSVWEALHSAFTLVDAQLPARQRIQCATILADAFVAHRSAGHSVVDRLGDGLASVTAIINLLVRDAPGKMTGLKVGDHSHIAFRCYDAILCYSKAGQLLHDDTLQQLAGDQQHLEAPWKPATSATATSVSLEYHVDIDGCRLWCV
jgi:hypothetical protein